MVREICLTYRKGTKPRRAHAQEFLDAFSSFCSERGIDCRLAAFLLHTINGTPYWLVLAEVPSGFSVPHLDKAGLWQHGVTSVVCYRGQVAADAVAWFAGLYTRWPIRVLPKFLTHSRNLAPDTSLVAL